MLRTIRDYSQSIFIYAIFGILVFVMAISFGPNSSSCGGPDVDFAARVDGDVIGRVEYGVQLDQQLRSFGGNLKPEQIAQLGIGERLIDGLIEKRLLVHEADARGLMVSNDELLERLTKAYGVKGVTNQQYKNWVQQTFQTTVPRFEARVRDEIKVEKLAKVVREGVSIADEEIKTEFLRQRDRAKVTFIRYNATNEDDISDDDPGLNDAAIKDLLNNEVDLLKARYDKDKFRLYHTAKQVKARQILKKISTDESGDKVLAAKTALEELKKQIEAGADFATLAAEHSDDVVSKVKGGDIGYVARGQRAADFVDKLFALKINEISAPVKTRQGWHLLQAVEIKEAADQPFDAVKEAVARSVLKAKIAEKAAIAEAQALLTKLTTAKGTLEELTWTQEEERAAKEAAREQKTPLTNSRPVRKQSEWLQKSQEVMPTFGKDPTIHDAIFSRSSVPDGGLWLDRPFKAGRWVYLLHVDAREQPNLGEFEKTKEALRDGAISDKQRQVYRAWVQYLRTKAKVELNAELFPPKPAGGIDFSKFNIGG